MKKKLWLSCSIFLFVVNAFGQKFIGQVVDALSFEPIAFVHLLHQEKGILGYTTKEGQFKLENLEEGDTITFGCIGYKTNPITITTEYLDANQVIKLESISYDIPDVKIEKKRLGEEILIGKRKYSNLYSGWTNHSKPEGGERALGVQNNKELWIRKIGFGINHNDYESVVFRVHVYELVDDEPGKDLLIENLFLEINGEKGFFELDISKHSLTIDGDFVISLEWIQGTPKDNPQLEKHILGIGSLKRTKRRKALRLFSKHKFSDRWIAVDSVPSIYCKVKEL